MNSVDRTELPPPDRAAQYRELAQEMHSRAVAAVSEQTRREYLRIASEWLDMAEQLESEYGKVGVTVPAPELASILRRHGLA